MSRAVPAFTITLDSQPVSPVLITLSNSDTSECSLVSTITMDSNNWQSGVGVGVVAVDDFVDGNQQCLRSGMTATSSDPKYHGIALAAVQVTVHSIDNGRYWAFAFQL
ncbi:MAG: hypothetical protein R2932_07355 [Caldilineaceae bacterium]